MRRTLAAGLALIALSTVAGLSTPHFSAGAEAASAEVAALQTATFAVENMICALCPVTVKAAIEDVEGVRSVEVDFAAKTAVVRFDASVTTANEITAASTNAGYPAAPQN